MGSALQKVRSRAWARRYINAQPRMLDITDTASPPMKFHKKCGPIHILTQR
jgi:hypothetical protein